MVKRIAAVLILMAGVAVGQAAPEHLYPTDEEAVVLYRIQLQRQHVIDEATEKITAINAQLQVAGEKIVEDHNLKGKFTYNVGSGQFEPVKKAEPAKK
jgi:hypothetical protein